MSEHPVLRFGYLVPFCFLVKRLGGYVETPRPFDGMRIRVDVDALEECGVS
jgi:hypothetical protein